MKKKLLIVVESRSAIIVLSLPNYQFLTVPHFFEVSLIVLTNNSTLKKYIETVFVILFLHLTVKALMLIYQRIISLCSNQTDHILIRKDFDRYFYILIEFILDVKLLDIFDMHYRVFGTPGYI